MGGIAMKTRSTSTASGTSYSGSSGFTGATRQLQIGEGVIAFDDTGGPGTLVIAAPGMGDLRGEYRYLTPYLTAAGYRVVTVDVRGHGESSAVWDDYSARAVGQ